MGKPVIKVDDWLKDASRYGRQILGLPKKYCKPQFISFVILASAVNSKNSASFQVELMNHIKVLFDSGELK